VLGTLIERFFDVEGAGESAAYLALERLCGAGTLLLGHNLPCRCQAQGDRRLCPQLLAVEGDPMEVLRHIETVGFSTDFTWGT
jgi:hypothetical protein